MLGITMHSIVTALFVGLSVAAPATSQAECPIGAPGALCPASAPAGTICCYDDVVSKFRPCFRRRCLLTTTLSYC
ncbi:hypothetical protein HZ326_26688 [Fusarium oxysporum f. sp. albedinis]|nr:hypothetical protein HZ326_26688 [Fusarium oxysporum f. sp. albedinis]